MPLSRTYCRRHCFLALGKHRLTSERVCDTANCAAFAAASGNEQAAISGFLHSLSIDPACKAAIDNLQALNPLIESRRKRRIAILSLLFNWPSTGGGIVHTKELAEVLQIVGYEVRHIYAEFPDWGIGNVAGPLPYPYRPVVFYGKDWCDVTIQDWFRDAVEEFAPDAAIVVKPG